MMKYVLGKPSKESSKISELFTNAFWMASLPDETVMACFDK